jgi:hypothetical protein
VGVPAWLGGPAAIESELAAVESQFGHITKELKTSNHFQAARMEPTGRLNTGSDHVKELTDFSNGLRNSAVRLKRVLSNPHLDAAARDRAQELLSNVSRLRDRITEALP